MKIAVLGAGLTGLTTAYRLTKQGHEVIIFEKETYTGGLASGFLNKGWEWPLERFYHHLFAGDKEAIGLIEELDLSSKLFFRKPLTAIYYSPPSASLSDATGYNSQTTSILPFDSPMALLKYPHLSLIDKVRTGLALAYLKSLSNYKKLEQETAERWLKKTMGKKAFEILWKPLLTAKFGTYSSQVTAAWFWARIKKRTQLLGYIEGGFQALTDRLVDEIKKNGGKVFLNKEVVKVAKSRSKFSIHLNQNDIYHGLFDVVISTIPTPIFLKMISFLPENYRKRLSQISHLWAQTLVLELKEPFLRNVYWLNINDSSFPFLATVQHTNFIDKSHYGGHHLLYIGNYLADNHPYLKKSAGELLEIFKPYLKKINSQFDNLTIFNLRMFSAPFAQPVITLGYQPPEIKTPVTGLYLANLDCVYPWDRGTNYAIELGEKVAKLVR